MIDETNMQMKDANMALKRRTEAMKIVYNHLYNKPKNKS